MEFNTGDTVIITCLPESIDGQYDGAIKEVIDEWVKILQEDNYEPEQDELIEPVDLSVIIS